MPTKKATQPPAAARPRARAARGRQADAARLDFQSDSLGYALRRAQMRAYDLFFEMLAAWDLSPARLTALSMVAMESDLNQATLARRLDIAGPSVLKLVDALEQSGFVRRMAVEGDRRRYSLQITDAGRSLLEQVRPELEAYEARLAERLKPAERAQLMALLVRVAT